MRMAKRIFFSFHYQDVIDFRANAVRQHWVTKPNRESAGFFDASLWEASKKQGDIALKRLINAGIKRTTVTCILIGSETYSRRWVKYEIMKSLQKGNQIFGVHINSIRGRDQRTKNQGPNPLEYLGVTFSNTGKRATLWEKKSGKWFEYTEIDNSTSYSINEVERKYWGEGFNLSQLFPTYDWVKDKGYENFFTWVN